MEPSGIYLLLEEDKRLSDHYNSSYYTSTDRVIDILSFSIVRWLWFLQELRGLPWGSFVAYVLSEDYTVKGSVSCQVSNSEEGVVSAACFDVLRVTISSPLLQQKRHCKLVPRRNWVFSKMCNALENYIHV